MKLLVQAIGADIKAILAKTNLLKTAAYRDVGTTAGEIPEFVGNDGIGGFGFGGSAKKLANGADLDLLPRVNALYTGGKNDGILNRPPDLVNYVFEHEFVLECVVGNTVGSYRTYVQRLTFDAYPPEGTSTTNPVVFIRSLSYLGFSPWVRLTGRLYAIDVGDEVVGDDLDVNSIKAGVTSPSVSFEVIRKDITYTNAAYNADGSRPNEYTGGRLDLKTTIHPNRILSMNARVYSDIYGSQHEYMVPNYSYSNAYYEILSESNGVIMMVKNASHAEQGGVMQHNGQNLFDKPSYIELFITYKAK